MSSSKEIIKGMEELKANVRELQDDMAKVKVDLVTYLPEEERQDVFSMTQHSTPEAFEDFTEGLLEPAFKKLVVRFMMATYGQKSFSFYCHSHSEGVKTDELMALYNCTWARKMRKLPESFERCIFSAVKHFHRGTEEVSLKRGKEEIKTSVKNEAGKQLEVYLSNSKSRIKKKSRHVAS